MRKMSRGGVQNESKEAYKLFNIGYSDDWCYFVRNGCEYNSFIQ